MLLTLSIKQIKKKILIRRTKLWHQLIQPLGVELMATGENAGTWGTKTNTNLHI